MTWQPNISSLHMSWHWLSHGGWRILQEILSLNPHRSENVSHWNWHDFMQRLTNYIGKIANTFNWRYVKYNVFMISNWIEDISCLGLSYPQIAVDLSSKAFALVKSIPVSINKLGIQHRALMPSLAGLTAASSVLWSVFWKSTSKDCLSTDDKTRPWPGLFLRSSWIKHQHRHPPQNCLCPRWQNRKGFCLDFQINTSRY